MSWLILFIHAFNPLLLTIFSSQLKNRESAQDLQATEYVSDTILSSFIAYLFWLGAHFLVFKIIGNDFSFDDFIGVDKGGIYFLPFMIGLALMIFDFIIYPKLKTEKALVLSVTLRNTLVFFGSYFMLVNYLSWLAG
jgi:hypothetical protein